MPAGLSETEIRKFNQEKTIEIQVLKGLTMIYTKNVIEDRVVCPLFARENPNWRCKEWYEEESSTNLFYDTPENYAELSDY